MSIYICQLTFWCLYTIRFIGITRFNLYLERLGLWMRFQVYLRRNLEPRVERFRKDMGFEYTNQAILSLVQIGLNQYERERGIMGEKDESDAGRSAEASGGVPWERVLRVDKPERETAEPPFVRRRKD